MSAPCTASSKDCATSTDILRRYTRSRRPTRVDAVWVSTMGLKKTSWRTVPASLSTKKTAHCWSDGNYTKVRLTRISSVCLLRFLSERHYLHRAFPRTFQHIYLTVLVPAVDPSELADRADVGLSSTAVKEHPRVIPILVCD